MHSLLDYLLKLKIDRKFFKKEVGYIIFPYKEIKELVIT